VPGAVEPAAAGRHRARAFSARPSVGATFASFDHRAACPVRLSGPLFYGLRTSSMELPRQSVSTFFVGIVGAVNVVALPLLFATQAFYLGTEFTMARTLQDSGSLAAYVSGRALAGLVVATLAAGLVWLLGFLEAKMSAPEGDVMLPRRVAKWQLVVHTSISVMIQAWFLFSSRNLFVTPLDLLQ